MANQTAQDAYKAAKKDIANLLGFFECELAKQPKEINWTHTGSLNRVRQDLLETLSFFSGFDIETIKETLEESRMLEEADAKIEIERK